MIKVFFNGAQVSTSHTSSKDFFLEHSSDEKNDVWILNGFATKENLAIKENDELFCIKKGVMPSKDVLESMMSARHTPKLHKKLKSASVAICGLGGLGSHIAIMLARSGVGHLRLIDFDIIEPSNLNRQAYRICDLGKLKTKALQDQIADINPFIKTTIHTLKITQENLVGLFSDDDIVCEAFDNPQTKALLAQNFHKYFPNKILICASGLAGYGNSNAIQTKKINDGFYICGDLQTSAQVGCGLIAPRVNICAAHQANLVLEILAKR